MNSYRYSLLKHVIILWSLFLVGGHIQHLYILCWLFSQSVHNLAGAKMTWRSRTIFLVTSALEALLAWLLHMICLSQKRGTTTVSTYAHPSSNPTPWHSINEAMKHLLVSLLAEVSTLSKNHCKNDLKIYQLAIPPWHGFTQASHVLERVRICRQRRCNSSDRLSESSL